MIYLLVPENAKERQKVKMGIIITPPVTTNQSQGY